MGGKRNRAGIFAGTDFRATTRRQRLRCPTNHPLYPQERRAETGMAPYASCMLARIRDCRACGLRVQCLAHGNETKRARRVRCCFSGQSKDHRLHQRPAASPKAAAQPILWRDWSRCQTRRRLMSLFAYAKPSPPRFSQPQIPCSLQQNEAH